ncbi:histone H1.4-like [Tiliqua scincoides]|uniref:histone H1.4-like n=1 Tax=Tiliqua scincoides TaxID=71010 RepID=UPI003462C0C8
MTEAVPAAPAVPLPAVKGPAKKAQKAASAPKTSGPSVTELLTQAVSASKERGGVSLAALKKSLAASGYDVEKNNSRIKLGLRSLVSKGTLVQTKGTGASGSFRLGKQTEAKKVPPAAATKGKKPAAAAAKGAKKAVAKKTAKAPKRPAASAGKKPVKKPKAKSPAKAAKPKAKPKTPKAKVAKPKKAAAPKK